MVHHCIRNGVFDLKVEGEVRLSKETTPRLPGTGQIVPDFFERLLFLLRVKPSSNHFETVDLIGRGRGVAICFQHGIR